MTPSDYPPEALRTDSVGLSRFTVTISPDGAVTSCSIRESSGSDVLDRKTCELVILRARFRPATNAVGKPTVGSWSSSVRWQIPKVPAKPPAAGFSVFSALIGTDGAATDCQFEQLEGAAIQGGVKVGPSPNCNFMPIQSPYLDAQGRPVAKRVRYTRRIEVFDVPAQQAKDVSQAN
ncbi:energy transducer TonB [Novosphingobium sp.]|uniref:energy transducer TonB n=1 Tax=Novosphingobium sp. TaxID=1874826 RepID=UPI00345BC4CE